VELVNYADRNDTWCFEYDPKANDKGMPWKQLASPRISMSKSQMKTMLIALFDIEGIFHFEFIPQGHTANQVYYVEIPKRLREAAHRK
jgi:hypothetical protein